MYLGAGLALAGAALFHESLALLMYVGVFLTDNPPVRDLVRGADIAPNFWARVRGLLRSDQSMVAQGMSSEALWLRKPLVRAGVLPNHWKVLLVSTIVGPLVGASSCGTQAPVHLIDPDSECAHLRASFPSQHGLILFSDTSTTTKAIPWCFPGTAGYGVIGYNVNISVSRPGTLLLVLSDIRPPTQFAAVSTEGTCWGDSTGKMIVRLGHGTQWSMPVVPGDYCISLITAERTSEDVWFTLTATRP